MRGLAQLLIENQRKEADKWAAEDVKTTRARP